MAVDPSCGPAWSRTRISRASTGRLRRVSYRTIGAPTRIRTEDNRIDNAALYQPELWKLARVHTETGVWPLDRQIIVDGHTLRSGVPSARTRFPAENPGPSLGP